MAFATEADREVAQRADGIFYGALSDDDRESVDRCVKDGTVRLVYEGEACFLLGLSKVRVVG